MSLSTLLLTALALGAPDGENTDTPPKCPGAGVCGDDDPAGIVAACGDILHPEPLKPKTVFATFNGGPGPTAGVQCGTENLLDVLEEAGVKATFFVAAANFNPAIQCAADDISCVRPALKNLFRTVRAGYKGENEVLPTPATQSMLAF